MSDPEFTWCAHSSRGWQTHALMWRGLRLATVEGFDSYYFGNIGTGWTGSAEGQLCRHVRTLAEAKAIVERKAAQSIKETLSKIPGASNDQQA